MITPSIVPKVSPVRWIVCERNLDQILREMYALSSLEHLINRGMSAQRTAGEYSEGRIISWKLLRSGCRSFVLLLRIVANLTAISKISGESMDPLERQLKKLKVTFSKEIYHEDVISITTSNTALF